MTQKISQYVGGTGVDNRNRFAVDGNTSAVVIGAAAAGQSSNLWVQGTGVFTSNLVLQANVAVPSGSQALLPITFSGDKNTGFYNSPDQILSVTGNNIITNTANTGFFAGSNNTISLGDSTTAWSNIYSVNIVAGGGSATNPSHSFFGDLNTGIYSPSADNIAVAANGIIILQANLSDLWIASTFVLDGTGSASNPVITNRQDRNTGIFFSPQDILNITTAGVSRLLISNAHTSPDGNNIYSSGFSGLIWSNTYTANTFVGDGSPVNPSIKFIGDIDTGLYRNTADTIGISAGGTPRINISTTSFSPTTNTFYDFGTSSFMWNSMFGSAIYTAGLVGTPGFSFLGDVNTGLYSPVADNIGFSTGGSLRSSVSNTGFQVLANTEFSGGYKLQSVNLGTLASFTVNPGNGPIQYGTNNGAFTITAPSVDGTVDILLTNGTTAGAITFSGFTVGSSTGDPLTTTNTQKFLLMIRRINSISTYTIKALQ